MRSCGVKALTTSAASPRRLCRSSSSRNAPQNYDVILAPNFVFGAIFRRAAEDEDDEADDEEEEEEEEEEEDNNEEEEDTKRRPTKRRPKKRTRKRKRGREWSGCGSVSVSGVDGGHKKNSVDDEDEEQEEDGLEDAVEDDEKDGTVEENRRTKRFCIR